MGVEKVRTEREALGVVVPFLCQCSRAVLMAAGWLYNMCSEDRAPYPFSAV